jgi:hypothetical protein
VLRPLPEVPWYRRTLTPAGAVHPVVCEDLFDQSETAHEPVVLVVVGVR